MKRALFAIATILVVASTACGAPPSGSARAQARAIEGQVWSPYCPGRLLSDCTTRQAFELRTRISDRLEQGETADEVLAWLRENYGAEILARPASDRRGVTIWTVPALLLLAGVGAVVMVIRKWSRTADVASPPGSRSVDEIRDEVHRDP